MSGYGFADCDSFDAGHGDDVARGGSSASSRLSPRKLKSFVILMFVQCAIAVLRCPRHRRAQRALEHACDRDAAQVFAVIRLVT